MKPKIYRTKPLKGSKQTEANYNQAKILNFDLERYQRSTVLLIGAGAIGTHVALALVRKGIGFLHLFDDDTVELKNLPRQLFSTRDVGKNKAARLSKMLSKQGFFETTITAHPYTFQEALELDEDAFNSSLFDCVICAVDNNPTRAFVAQFCLEQQIPLVTSAVSRDGNQMYCAVQEPFKACFGCIVPHAVNDDSYPCNLPGIIDIIQVVSGYTVYALDTVVMDRPREWNLKTAFLDGGALDQGLLVPKKTDCALCGTKAGTEPEKPDHLLATKKPSDGQPKQGPTGKMPEYNPEHEYLTQAELAKRWRMSQSCVKNWRAKGQVPYFQVPGSRRVLYSLQDIQNLERRNAIPTKEVSTKTERTGIRRKKPEISATPRKEWRI